MHNCISVAASRLSFAIISSQPAFVGLRLHDP